MRTAAFQEAFVRRMPIFVSSFRFESRQISGGKNVQHFSACVQGREMKDATLAVVRNAHFFNLLA